MYRMRPILALIFEHPWGLGGQMFLLQMGVGSGATEVYRLDERKYSRHAVATGALTAATAIQRLRFEGSRRRVDGRRTRQSQ
jgi:hypothetical protein